MGSSRAAGARAQPTQTSVTLARVIATLNQYKELITLIVFFAGGATWLLGYFATKEQVKQLRCFATESLRLTKAQAQLRYTFDDIAAASRRVSEIQAKEKAGSLTLEETQERERLLVQLQDLKNERMLAKASYEAAEKKLMESACTEGL